MVTVNKRICNFLATEWVRTSKSNRNFALGNNIDEKTVIKILQEDDYRMPLKTLHKISVVREIKIPDFL